MDMEYFRGGKIVSLHPGRGDGGFGAIGRVEAYWEGLRDGRLMPTRAEVDPRGITDALEQAFILEKIAPGWPGCGGGIGRAVHPPATSPSASRASSTTCFNRALAWASSGIAPSRFQKASRSLASSSLICGQAAVRLKLARRGVATVASAALMCRYPLYVRG
mgnify:CR=1 FL=1